MRILILGAGKMISALLEGFIGSADFSNIYIYSPSGVSAQTLAKKVNAKWVTDLGEIEQIDYVWLGCKPQQLSSLSGILHKNVLNAVFISFLAAIPEDDQRKILGIEKLIRVMPNLNVRLRKGISLISSKSSINHLDEVKEFFNHVGDSLIVEENELDELTLLTGSGPAFLYEFTKYLAESFTSLTPPERERLAKAVLIGAGASLSDPNVTLDELINSVTSKGGVTIATLDYWRGHQLQDEVKTGIKAGKKRSLELLSSIHHT